MTMVLDHRASTEESGAIRWWSAALIVVCAHAGLMLAALNWPRPDVAPGIPDNAIMIDLEPPAVSQAPPADVPPGEEAQPEEQVPEPVPDVAETEPPVEEPPPPEPVTPVEPMPELPTPPPTPTPPQPDAVVLPPKPTPPPPKPKKIVEQVRPKPDKPVVKKPEPRKVAQQRTAPASTSAQAQRSTTAAGAAGVSPAARANWQSQVAAHLNRFKKPTSNGASGVARVSFRIGGGGQVVSASLAGSSGDSTLDQEALALVRRASPVPAPPPEMGASVALVVPVRFTR